MTKTTPAWLTATSLIATGLAAPQMLLAQADGDPTRAAANQCPHVCCLCTCQGPQVCDIWDLLAFNNDFAAGNPCAIDLDTSTGVGVGDLFDFLAFQRDFIDGVLFGFAC